MHKSQEISKESREMKRTSTNCTILYLIPLITWREHAQKEKENVGDIKNNNIPGNIEKA